MLSMFTPLHPTKTHNHLALILALVVLYMLGFPWLTTRFGPVSATLIVIPVAVTGWYFKPRMGFFAGIAGVFLNLILFFFSRA